MKNLILILSLCLVLFSCFEKEEEVTVVPSENVEECEKYKKFIDFVNNNPPRNPRSTIKKYNYNNEIVYLFQLGIDEETFDHFYPFTIDAKCNLICDASPPDVDEIPLFCDDWNENAIYIETIWEDER